MPQGYQEQEGNWGRYDNVPVQPAGGPGIPQAYADVSLDPSSFQNGFAVTIVPPLNLTDTEAAYFTVEYGGGGAGVSIINDFVRRRTSFNVPGSSIRVKAWLQHEAVTVGATFLTKSLGVFVASPGRNIVYPFTSINTYVFPIAPVAQHVIELVNRNVRAMMFSCRVPGGAPVPLEFQFETLGGINIVLFSVDGVSELFQPVRVPNQAGRISFTNRTGLSAALQVTLLEEF